MAFFLSIFNNLSHLLVCAHLVTYFSISPEFCFDSIYDVKGICHKDIVILGQFFLLIIAFTHIKNALV